VVVVSRKSAELVLARVREHLGSDWVAFISEVPKDRDERLQLVVVPLSRHFEALDTLGLAPTFEPEFVYPAPEGADPAHRLVAPQRFEGLQLRAALPIGPRFVSLGYEGNNKNFRAAPNDSGLYRDGAEAAKDWRRYISGVKSMIVLRDSLFSQQDHPYLQSPQALMMPPNWVSVAVAEVQAGRPIVVPFLAGPEDDRGWAAVVDAKTLFGSFPPSESLFTYATAPYLGASPDDAARTINARRSMAQLEQAARAMQKAAAFGAEAVAAAGAAYIAASDRRYFGVVLRRDKLIPIFVENPNEHETRDEGKGMTVWGRELPEAAVALARRAVYSRRLEDGALGVERYDLREAAARSRAISLLEELIPSGSQGHSVWLWVNGGSDGHGKGDPATPYVPAFQEQLAEADIELERLVLLSKPSLRPWGDDGAQILEDARAAHAKLGIPLSVQLSTRGLQKLMDP
jgi:hypothetical protein